MICKPSKISEKLKRQISVQTTGCPKKVGFRKIAKPLIKWPFRCMQGDKWGLTQVWTHWEHVPGPWLWHVCDQDPKISIF